MNTAIIGLGNIGSRVARNLIAGGERIIIADRHQEIAQSLAAESRGKAEAMDIAKAIARADIVVPCIWFTDIQHLFEQYRDHLAGKIIVDPSNPIAPDGKGGFAKIIPQDESAGQILAARVPQGATLVKAFGSIRAESMATGANRLPEPAVLFYASDDLAAGDAVARLIAASGFSPVRIGGIDQSIRMEVFGDLSEAGKLGRLVSLSEAKALLEPAA